MNRFKKRRQLEAPEPQHAAPRPAAAVADDVEQAQANDEDEEGEDYMSEAFLAQFEQQQQQSASRTIGRKRPPPSSGSGAAAPAPPLSRKQKQQQAEEKLQEGLTTPLPEDNIGMRLLKLMGFGGKAGHQGLGKAADGIAEPLAVTRRLGREGLGGLSDRKQERAGRREELARLRAEWAERRKAEFTQAMSTKFAERRVAGQLVRAMKTVETLDERAGRPRSRLWWSSEQGVEEEEGGGGEAGVGERSELVEEDVGDAAAGAEPSVCGADATGAGEGAGEEEEEDDDLWPSLTNAEKLSIVLAYLRSEHCYCLWCGHQYQSAALLAAECPGEAEEDH